MERDRTYRLLIVEDHQIMREGIRTLVETTLRALPDIANAYRAGLPPSSADLARLLPFTDMLHFKDYANAAQRFVALGEGDIPFAALLGATLPAHEGPLTLTIETHAPSEPAATTRRSVYGLRQLADSLGLV